MQKFLDRQSEESSFIFTHWDSFEAFLIPTPVGIIAIRRQTEKQSLLHFFYCIQNNRNNYKILSLLKIVWFNYETKIDVIRKNCSTNDVNHIIGVKKELYFDKIFKFAWQMFKIDLNFVSFLPQAERRRGKKWGGSWAWVKLN